MRGQSDLPHSRVHGQWHWVLWWLSVSDLFIVPSLVVMNKEIETGTVGSGQRHDFTIIAVLNICWPKGVWYKTTKCVRVFFFTFWHSFFALWLWSCGRLCFIRKLNTTFSLMEASPESALHFEAEGKLSELLIEVWLQNECQFCRILNYLPFPALSKFA